MASYKIIGSDRAEYGPVTSEQLRQWIAEGRLDANTMIQLEGTAGWRPLSTFPDFAGALPPAAPPTIGGQPLLHSPPRTNPMALTGLIMGALSLVIGWACCTVVVLAPLGIIFSMIGISQINRNPSAETGKGLAIAGLILSVLGLLMTVLLLVLVGMGGLTRFLQENGPMQ